LKIVDISDPTTPFEVGSFDTPENAMGVAKEGEYAYIADTYDGLWIVNVSNPANPMEAGHYITADAAVSVAVSGNYAYIAEGNEGLLILDISDPGNPLVAGYLDTPGYAKGIVIYDNLVFLADDAGGLRIVNIAEISAPNEVGYYDGPGFAYDVAVGGNFAYVAQGFYFDILDFSDALPVNSRIESVSSKMFSLHPPIPNPCNAKTKLVYSLLNSGEISLRVFSINGMEVASIYEGYKSSGNYQADFDGSQLPSGVYFVSFQVGNYSQTQKLILLK
jgi:hypothetical protein